MPEELDWKHYEDEKMPDFWLEVAEDAHDLCVRGPSHAIGYVTTLAEKADQVECDKLFHGGGIEVTPCDKMTYLHGPKKVMLSFIRLAIRSGPGPLEKMVIGD